MIRTAEQFGAEGELAHRADMLARFVRSAPRFSDALRWWAGFDLRRQPRVPDERYATDRQAALLLDLAPGTLVTRRDGYLISAISSDDPFRLARAVALVHEPALALDSDQRAALRAGAVPLSQILRAAQRATHYALRVAGEPLDDEPALRSRATLLCAGRPVALVRETVYWRLLTHRAPGQPSRYLRPTSPHARAGWDPL